MKLLRAQDYRVQPWKNRLGVTREIYSETVKGRLAWRLSLADVTADGAFSEFPGCDRILTVVEGNGMRLTSEATEYRARPFSPLRFSGDTRITGYCVDGPVTNFNLIFDRALVDAFVTMTDESEDRVQPEPGRFTVALYVLTGHVPLISGNSLMAGDSAVFQNGPLPRMPAGTRGIGVTLQHRIS